ncbi:glycosyltransferase family 61 protein [Methylorubrum aminovorans]|uniref:glycosyltransferase family 61 protein n=1 Tax=Methylorubrum aminovorans TaxID=269069 RepID=UPI003C2C7220
MEPTLAAPPIVELRTAVEAGHGSVTDLSLSRRASIRPPDFLIGQVTPLLLRQYFGQSVELGTSLYRIGPAAVTAAGHILIDGALAWSYQLGVTPEDAANATREIARLWTSLSRRRIEGEVVLLAGAGHLLYGHWLVDFLPKLVLLEEAGYDIRRQRYLLPADTPAFARQWLRLLGIADDQIIVYDRLAELVECRVLVVPTLLRFLGRASPTMGRVRDFLLSRLQGGRNRSGPCFPWPFAARRRQPERRKLLVARSINPGTLGRRHLVEREMFEAKAQARGFSIVRPESMGIGEQVALFRTAGTICGEYGSGLHNTLFVPFGARILSLQEGGQNTGFLQSSLDHALGHESGYVVGTACGLNGRFSIASEDIDMGLDWLEGLL